MFQYEFAPAGGPTIYRSNGYTSSSCDDGIDLGAPGDYYLSVLANDWPTWTVIVDPD